MEPLFKDNLKVHFAGCENLDKLTALHTVGVKYFLFTCYPFVKQMINGKLSNKNRNNIIPSLVSSLGEHAIMAVSYTHLYAQGTGSLHSAK